MVAGVARCAGLLDSSAVPVVLAGGGGGGGGGGVRVPLFPTNFPCVPLFPKSMFPWFIDWKMLLLIKTFHNADTRSPTSTGF